MATTAATGKKRHPRIFLEVMGSRPGGWSYRLWVRGQILATSGKIKLFGQVRTYAMQDAPGVPLFQRRGGKWCSW
jgi:hypothetical protein